MTSMTKGLRTISGGLLKLSMEKRQALINSNTRVVPLTRVSRMRLAICMVLENLPGLTEVNIMDSGTRT